MGTVTDDRRGRDRVLGFFGGLLSLSFFGLVWIAISSYESGPILSPSGIFVFVAVTTGLGLFVWSVGRLTGHYYDHERSYSLVVGVLSSLSIAAILVLAGYLLATYPGSP